MLNIDTDEVEQPTLNIDSGTAPATPPSDAVAQTRSYKAHMGLGDIVKMNYDEIYRNISEGQEDNLRKQAAFEITSKATDDKQSAIVDLAAKKGSALTLDDIQHLDTTPANPTNVIEQSYSRAYVNTLKDSADKLENNVITDAQAQDPAAVDAYFHKGSEVLSKREYALTAEQNLQPAVDQAKYYSFKLPDSIATDPEEHSFSSYDLKQLATFGLYDEAMLRGLGNTGRFRGAGLGENIDQAIKDLLDSPDFEKKFDEIKDNLAGHDPVLAQKFAHYVAGMSSSDKYINDAMTAVNLTMGKGLLNVARAGLRSAGERQAATLGRRATNATDLGGLEPGADGVFRPGGGEPPAGGGGGGGALTIAQAQKAVSDVVKSANVPEVTKATIAEGAGDVKEAAVQKAVQSAVLPDYQKDSLDTLFSLYRSDQDALRDNPGNLSREEHTRLLDAGQGFEKNTVDLLVNSSKPIRTPALVEDGFRGIADQISTYFPGRENTIGDVNVRYDPITSTYHIDTQILNYGGVPFSSYELAVNHAHLNGYPLAIAGDLGEKVYLPKAALFKTEYPDEHTSREVPRAFEVQRLPDGSFKFLTDGGVEIQPSANPQAGHIPYNLTTNKFENPLTEESARIEQQGLGFHIVVTKPLDETTPYVRDNLIGARQSSVSNVNTSRLTSTANAIIGLIRNPYDTLSAAENENRVKATFGQVKYINAIKQEIASVEDIYKGMLGDRNVVLEKPVSYMRTVTGANRIVADRFTRALEASQTLPDPKTALPGYYMKTPAEIQHFWESNFHAPASFKEQQAYLAVGRLDHFDHILRQSASYMYKVRLGVEKWHFITNEENSTTISPRFDAKQIKIAPSDASEDVTAIHDSTGRVVYWHQMSPKTKKEFREKVEQGKFTGLEIYDPEKRPLNLLDEDGNRLRVRYVFSNVMKSEPLTYDQIGYRGGGHWDYDYENSVKQPIIRNQWVGNRFQHIYEDDSTFGFVANRAMGEQFAKNMNEVARLIRAKDITGAKAYAATHFDIEWKDLYAGFRPAKNPTTGEIQPPRFSTDPRQEFRVVPKGRSIKDLDKELELKYTKIHPKTGKILSTFVDGTKHGSLARNFQVAYSQPRESYDMKEPVNVGSVDKPFYQFRPAKLTDPITTLTRSMNRIVNSTYMDSVKIASAEHWLQENKGLIDATLSEIRSSPFYYFNEGKFKNNPNTILQQVNARTNRYKIQQFLGTPSTIDSAIHGVKQALSDALYEAGRDTAIAVLDKKLPAKVATVVKAPLVAPEWLLDRIHNPVDFLRGMTYHLTLGLFVPKQMVVQSMAYTTIFGLAGMKYATAGSFAALMHQWTRVSRNPEIVSMMDRRATLFGWKVGEFTEATKLLDKTSFGHIGNEISLDNGLHKESFFRNDAKAFMDKGQRFFNEGNLHVRYGAFFTAFKEFRDKNPVMKIGPIEEGKILYRANYFNALMTRDANTVLNKGLVGVPFQFYDYMKKMADVFWSKNIGETPSQRAYVRARMFLLYAMLGGAAGATGVTGLPFGDTIRKHAIAGDLPGQTDAYFPGDKLWSTLLMEGPTSTFLSAIIGGGDMSKGTFYNFNNRFNPNGLQVLRDVVQTDPTFWKILLGAMGSTVANEIGSLSGFVNAMHSMIEGDPAKEAWPLKMDDWLAPLQNVSSWSDGKKLYYGLAYGKWLDRHGAQVSDVSKPDAVFRILSGLTDQRIDDMYLKELTMKDRKVIYDEADHEYQEQRRMAERAAMDGDKEQADDYNKRAIFALTSRNVPTELWAKIMAKDAQINTDTIKQLDERYYRKLVPTNKQDQSLDAYKKMQGQ